MAAGSVLRAELAALLDRLPKAAEYMRRPDGVSAAEWERMAPQIDIGNARLFEKMHSNSPFAEYEHAGVVAPGGEFRDMRTDRRPEGVSIHANDDDVVVHSHPHAVSDTMRGVEYQLPPTLSGPDTIAVGLSDDPIQGITSIEPRGNVAYATRGKRAKKLKISQDEAEALLEKAFRAAKRGSGEDGPFTGLQFNISGDNSAAGSAIAGAEGFARALKKQRLLKDYGRTGATEGQKETMRYLEPGAKDAEGVVYRALHGKIHGLPWPLTYGRLAGAGGAAGLLGLRGALDDMLNERGR